MAQASRTSTAIPDLVELHRHQSSPEGRTLVAIRDLLVAIEDLDDHARNPVLFRVIAAERGDLDLAHTVLGMLVARALRGQLRAHSNATASTTCRPHASTCGAPPLGCDPLATWLVSKTTATPPCGAGPRLRLVCASVKRGGSLVSCGRADPRVIKSER
jgi:hypothetical protein